jgi:hypothetical protein
MIAQGIAIWYFVLTLITATPYQPMPTTLSWTRIGRFASQVACEQARQDFLAHMEESSGGASVSNCQMRMQP